MSRKSDLPSAIDIEKALLSCVIKSPEVLLDCLCLTEADFYLVEHQKIWQIIRELDSQGIAPDLHLVCQRAGEKGLSVAYVAGIVTDEFALPSQVSYYVEVLRDKSRRRKLIVACQATTTSLVDGDDLEAIEAGLIEQLTDKGEQPDVQTLSSVAEESLPEILSRDGRIAGISFGIPELDAETGGMHPADLIVLAGRTGMGKSAAGLKIGYEAALLGYKVLYVTIEMPPKDLYLRLLTIKTRIPLKMLRNGNKFYDKEKEAIRKADEELRKLPLAFFYQSAISCQNLRQVARSEKLRGNCDLLVIDHAGRMRSGKKTKSDYEEVSEIAVSLKNLAIELNIPVLALYQLSRNVEHRQEKRPVLADLRGSGRIEEEADVILFLYRESYYKRDAKNTLEINIAKQRNGEAGDMARIVMPFENLWRENDDLLSEISDEEVPF